MSSLTIFSCDYEGCTRALGGDDVAQIHLCVHQAQMPPDLEPDMQGFALDLCDEHLDLVLGRILTSNTV